MSHAKRKPVPFTGIIEGAKRSELDTFSELSREARAFRQKVLADIYHRLYKKTGHERFLDIAVQEKNRARRIERGI